MSESQQESSEYEKWLFQIQLTFSKYGVLMFRKELETMEDSVVRGNCYFWE